MNQLKTIVLVIFCLINTATLSGQDRLQSTDGFASFYSSAPLENIYAENKIVTSIIDLSNNEIAVVVPIKQFSFKKKLMQKHFNEKYLESHIYPNATFTGHIYHPDSIVPKKTHAAYAEGDMTIHGVTKSIKLEGTYTSYGDSIVLKTEFTLRPEDYKVKIPKLLRRNIAEEVLVKVYIRY